MRSRPFISFFTQENFFAFTISHNYKSQFLIMKFQNSVLIFSYHESGLHFADFTKHTMKITWPHFSCQSYYASPGLYLFFFKINKIIVFFPVYFQSQWRTSAQAFDRWQPENRTRMVYAYYTHGFGQWCRRHWNR